MYVLEDSSCSEAASLLAFARHHFRRSIAVVPLRLELVIGFIPLRNQAKQALRDHLQVLLGSQADLQSLVKHLDHRVSDTDMQSCKGVLGWSLY